MMDSVENLEGKLEAGASKYGAVEAKEVLKGIKRPEKKQAAFPLILACLVAPLLIFVITYSSMLYVRYSSSFVNYALVALMLLASLSFGVMAYGASQGKGGDSLWLGLVCILGIVGWGWAVFDANTNFLVFIQPSYDLQQLNVYKNVNPSNSLGNQYMDFAVLEFVEKSYIDRKHAMAFKNGVTYCVAPVKVAGAKQDNYDFWAVGINCCSSQRDYYCNAPGAHSGLRVARESQRSFYQLAVEQAAAAYDIQASTPLFFEMVENPFDKISELQDHAFRSLIFGSCRFLCMEVVIIVIAAFAFSKA